MLNDLWPPAHSAEFLALLAQATLQTLAIATAGMTLALLLSIPAALLATAAVGTPAWLRWPVRSLLVFLRSVPELVWALLFVRAVGLGPTAGVLAIAITYSGMLGKVYAEIFESVDARPARALLDAGSSRLAAFCYGILPNAASEMVSYSVYRWECALRASVVMGFVGAGGLGQQVDLSLRLFAGDEVATLLLVFLALVLLADRISRFLRDVLDREPGRQHASLAVLPLAAIASFGFLSLDWQGLFSASGLRQMLHYASGFFPADFSTGLLHSIGHGAIATLLMSASGTLLAALAGLLLALPAAGRCGSVLQAATRLLLNALRAIPELVWAALMVLAAGLGPVAGALALALHTGGVLGRLFAEALENLPPAPAQALRESGSGHIAAFCYGAWPLLWPQLLAYTLYRWENNIRMAAVLGFVGAGGLGQMLYVHLSLFQEAQAATVILAMLLLVLAVDVLSNLARRRWVS